MAGKFFREVLSKPSPESTSFWGFLWAVKRHWVTLMSGGGITVTVALVERLTGKNVPAWVYVSILIQFVVCACYLAWRDVKRKENEAVSQLKNLTRHKIKFELNEVNSRIFVNVPSSGDLAGHLTIHAKVKLRFENNDNHLWTMKELLLTLHELEPSGPQEVSTYVVEQKYMDSSTKQPIPQNEFEGMAIQGGEVTDWYRCMISLVPVGFEQKVKKPEDLTTKHFLRLTMEATSQEPLTANISVNWCDATTSFGAAMRSDGVPAIRIGENRRLGTLND